MDEVTKPFRQEESSRGIKVTLELYLPEHQEDLYELIHVRDYIHALHEIYHKCRSVWKYEDSPPEEKLKFAEEIAALMSHLEIY